MASLRGRMNQERRKHSFRGSLSTTNSHVDGERRPLLSSQLTSNSTVIVEDDEHAPWTYRDSRPWVSYPAGFVRLTWLVLISNYVNVLLVFVPLGIVAGNLNWNPIAVFILNFLAIVPLAALLSFATEELSAELGETIGGLMNASFGNAVELIVAIMALIRNEIVIVQTGMLGSILSNILLVLGSCFISGGVFGSEGWENSEQVFSMTAANTMSDLLAVATASLIIPAALSASISASPSEVDQIVLNISHGTAVILLILYCLFLFFQLKSHHSIFDAERQEEEESEESRLLSPIPATIALVLITLLVAWCAEYLVDSIDSVVEQTSLSRTFIGLILLPIVGNAAEHVTAIIVAAKGKMDLAIGVAIGSSLQIALFVTPFMVILGWIIDRKMSLHFGGFETVVFFVSVQVVNYLIQDGKSNYLEGCLCIGTYIIIAIAFYMYPDGGKDVGSMIKSFFGH